MRYFDIWEDFTDTFATCHKWTMIAENTIMLPIKILLQFNITETQFLGDSVATMELIVMNGNLKWLRLLINMKKL